MNGVALARRRPRKLARRAGRNVLALAVLVVLLFPVYWMVATAFKPGRDILLVEPKWFPSPFTLENFREAIDRPYFWDAVKNSLIVVGAVVVLSLVLAFLAALALAKFRFYGRKAFIVAIIAVQMIPLNGLIIPLYVLLARAGQIDKLGGVIVTYLTFALPFTVWTLRGFILGVPRELEEAYLKSDFGRGAAISVLMLVIVAALSVVYVRKMVRLEEVR